VSQGKLLRIGMWSGPRNISTALMRSFGNRDDCVVYDEPLYAHYLRETRLDHPGRAEICEHHEADWRKVVDQLLAPLPHGEQVFYQKHMAHHLLPNIDRDWLKKLRNCFLIREPSEMLTSLSHKLANIRFEDTGLPQQLEIYRMVQAAGEPRPIVLDARDILEHPRDLLKALCSALHIEFQESMLSWPAGRRESDGIWARYWYHAVEQSTGFQPYVAKRETVPESMISLLEDCQTCYQKLYEHRLKAGI